MISQVFGCLLAMYFLVGRWSIERLDGALNDESALQQPRVWIVAMLAIWALIAMSGRAKKSVGSSLTSIDAAICLFLGYMLFTALWSPNSELAYDKATEMALLLAVAIVFAVSRPALSLQEVSDGFWWAIVLVGVAMASLAIVSSTGGRVYVPGGGPNTFGRNMGLMALGGAHLTARYGKKMSPIAAGMMIIAMLLIIMCGSRGALLSTSIGFLVLLVTARTSLVNKFAAATAVGLAGAAFLFTTVTGRDALEIFQTRIVDATIHDRYLSARDDLWLDAIDWAKERPVFGWGLNGYRANSWTYPHNMFLEVIVEGGCVGLLLLLNVARGWCSQVMRSRFQVPRVPVAALALAFTAAQTSGDLFDSRGVFLMLVLSAPAIIAPRRSHIGQLAGAPQMKLRLAGVGQLAPRPVALRASSDRSSSPRSRQT
jgi:O-antigen ligase